jgi:hypothetical protein
LSIGQSEELIQRYYDFVESLNALSVKKIDVFHKERWLPIKIKKSEVRLAPLRFLPAEDPEHASFGPQPLPASSAETNNSLHYGETFQIGRAKRPVEYKYVVTIDSKIKKIPVLADKIVGPSKVLTSGVDFWLEENRLYFIKNPFDSDEYLKYELFDDAGHPLTFTWEPQTYSYSTQEHEDVEELAEGTVLNEEEIILWAYHAETDQHNLRDNFGVLLCVEETDPEVYKQILTQTVNLLTEGPTIQAVTSLAASFLGVSLTQDPVEILVDAYTVEDTWFVITDKRVYTANTFFNLSEFVYFTHNDPQQSGVRVGVKLPAGTPLFDAVRYYDNVSQPGWWRTELSRLVLPGSMFIGDYQGVLTFENIASFVARGDSNKLRFSPDIINTVPGALRFPFPPAVTLVDQAMFNNHISHADRYDTVRGLLEASLTEADLLDPLDFAFTHFLKTNTAMLRIRFQTLAQAASFAHIFHLIKACLPRYVHTIFDFDLSFPQDIAQFATNTTDSLSLSSDGSDQDGWVAVPPYNDPPWQVRFGFPASVLDPIRPFSISRSLDLMTTYTDAYGTFYQNTNNLTGVNAIVQDNIGFTAKYLVGEDAANLPIAYQKTGQIQVVQAGLVVTGTGTKFLNELHVGDRLYSMGDSNEYRVISEITSDTSLKIASAFSGTTRTINLWVAHDLPSTRNIGGLIFWSL